MRRLLPLSCFVAAKASSSPSFLCLPSLAGPAFPCFLGTRSVQCAYSQRALLLASRPLGQHMASFYQSGPEDAPIGAVGFKEGDDHGEVFNCRGRVCRTRLQQYHASSWPITCIKRLWLIEQARARRDLRCAGNIGVLGK